MTEFDFAGVFDDDHLYFYARIVTERTIVRDGRTRTVRFTLRWFSAAELRDWLRAAGVGSFRAPGLGVDRRLVADRLAT